MLASPAEPFDSGEHVFEVKWDGVRALAAVESGNWRLWGRESADYTGRYPELDVLRRLPPGTLVDGEVVVLRDGRADLSALLSRHVLASSTKIELARRYCPVCYILFDALYYQGRSLLSEPLWRRRMVLTDLMEKLDEPTLVFSEGITCTGQDFFERVIEQGHEGVVAKHLAGRYHPGRRSTAWQKIKPAHQLPCVVIGYTPAPSGLHSLLVGECRDGSLRYVAELTAGFTAQAQAQLGGLLAGQVRARPVVPCNKRAVWVEPQVYCRVRFQHRTANGFLRGASFGGLLNVDNEGRQSKGEPAGDGRTT
jgi:bifunctional non-homologous end joining protein LigD